MPDELLDVVNNDDVVTGQNLRSVIHNSGFLHRGVHVFLSTHDGRLLVQRRSKDRAASPSLLDCSISEHVRAGEDYLTAAIRGLKEELGLESIDIQAVVTFKMNYGPNDNEISRVFQGFVDPAKVQFDPVELDQVFYFSWTELLERMTADGITFCTWFVQMVNWAIGRPSQLGVLIFHNNLQHSFDAGLNGSDSPKTILP